MGKGFAHLTHELSVLVTVQRLPLPFPMILVTVT